MENLDPRPQTLTLADAAWLHAEAPTNHFVVTSLSLLDGEIEPDRLEKMLARRIGLHPRLRQVIDQPQFQVGPPRWVPAPNFDIRAHIHRVALPAPGGRRELEEYVGDLVGQPLDFGRPLWEVHLVSGTIIGQALVTRIHHSLGDGQALGRMLLSLTDESADGWKRRIRARQPRNAAGRGGLGVHLRRVADLAASLGRVTEAANQAAGLATALAHITLLSADEPTHYRRELGLLKRVAWSRPLPLDLIKSTARATGTTVNDVVVSAIAGGLGACLRELGQETSGLRIRAMVPVNVRPEDDSEMTGNKFSLVFLELPLGQLHPWERLMRVKLEMDRIKASHEPAVGWLMLRGMGILPPRLERIMSDFYASKASLVLTNVIGPGHRVFLAGAPIREMTFWEPESGGLGLGVSIYSYAGQVTVGVVSDDNALSDPSALAGAFESAFIDLARVAGVKLGAEQDPRIPVPRKVARAS